MVRNKNSNWSLSKSIDIDSKVLESKGKEIQWYRITNIVKKEKINKISTTVYTYK